MGVALTTWEVMDERAEMLRVLSEICREVGSNHALLGGIAVGYHSRVRATVDVDLLVPKNKLGRIAKALEERGFTVVKGDEMLRVYAAGGAPDRDESIADLLAIESNTTRRAASKSTEPATVLGQEMRVVTRGALVALKFQAAISSTRRMGDRYIDVGDIDRIVRTKFDAADEALALDIADTIYPGARADLAQLLDDLRHDRPVKL